MIESQYRIEARGQDRELFLIITGSRARALHFAKVFLGNPEYTQVSVEIGGRVWIGDRIGEMP